MITYVNSVNFGELLAHHLAKNGLSQSDLSRRVGDPQAWISQIIKGKRTPPLDRIESWADALHLTGPERERFILEAHLAHCTPVIAARFRQLEATISALEARMDARDQRPAPAPRGDA
jgi:transcriptional regulator with XRE-family HTH domain